MRGPPPLACAKAFGADQPASSTAVRLRMKIFCMAAHARDIIDASTLLAAEIWVVCRAAFSSAHRRGGPFCRPPCLIIGGPKGGLHRKTAQVHPLRDFNI